MNPPPVWGEADLSLPPWPDEPPPADLYVVGLGGAGLAAVTEGLARGLRVVGIDRHGVAGGASGRNGGFLLGGRADFFHRTVTAVGTEEARALYRLTTNEIARMAAQTPEAVRAVGSWRVAADAAEEADLFDHYASLRLAGIAAERQDTPWGPGLLLPDDAAFDPVARATAVGRAVLDGGASLFTGEVDPAALPRPVVVAVDGGLERLVPALAGRVRTARLQMLATAPTSAVSVSRPVYRRWGYDYFQQRPDGSILVGGLRDRFVDHEWSDVAEPTDEVQAGLDRLLADVVGGRAVEVTHRWAGCSAFTTDHRPVCEVVNDGMVAVGGYSGTGNVVGPLCGRAAVQLLFDGTSALAAVLTA